MKELGKFILYLVAVLVSGALLAPLLWELGQWVAVTGDIRWLKKIRFPTYFNRGVLISALVFLYPFIRSLGLSSWRELGITPHPHRRAHALGGAALGMIGLGAAAGCLLWLAQSQLRIHFKWSNVALGLSTAVAVALIEEIFFRGVLYGVMRRHLAWGKALAMLSVVFAALHFLKPHPSLKRFAEEVTWSSGFTGIPKLFWQFGEPALWVGGFLTLVMVGWILGYVTEKTNSLWMAIGLHGGWVFALRVFTLNSRRVGDPTFWFGRDLITGAAPLRLLVVTLGVLVAAFRWSESRAVHE